MNLQNINRKEKQYDERDILPFGVDIFSNVFRTTCFQVEKFSSRSEKEKKQSIQDIQLFI